MTMWPHEATLGPMKQVGLRELKNRLSEYVRLVRAGEHVQITDRGQVVADLAETVQGAPVRRSAEDLTVFKSVGMAFEDLAVARAIVDAR